MRTSMYDWPQAVTVLMLVLAVQGCQSLPAPVSAPHPAATPSNQQQAVSAYAQTCTHLHTDAPFALQAKLAVQHAGKGYTARVQWQHGAAQDQLDIYSPLGQQLASIVQTTDGVVLTDAKGNRYSDKDTDSLTQQLLGWRLPLQGLRYWVMACPHPSSAYQVFFNEQSQLSQLHQDQWQIQYDEFQPASTPAASDQRSADILPTALRLQQNDLRIKLLIQDWQR